MVWKVGLVSKAILDKDGMVRRVFIKYENSGDKAHTEIERPVQNIVVISASECKDQ